MGKPYKEFPFFPHPNGQWCQKIKGKLWYFSKWEDQEATLHRDLDEVDHIQTGHDLRPQGVVPVSDSVAVARMLALLLGTMDQKCKFGKARSSQLHAPGRNLTERQSHLLSEGGAGRMTRHVHQTQMGSLRCNRPAAWFVPGKYVLLMPDNRSFRVHGSRIAF